MTSFIHRLQLIAIALMGLFACAGGNHTTCSSLSNDSLFDNGNDTIGEIINVPSVDEIATAEGCREHRDKDTTTLMRSTGLQSRETYPILRYPFQNYPFYNGVYLDAEKMALVDEDKVGEYLLSHSGPKLRNYAQNNKIIVLLKVSELGRISDVVLLRPNDDDLKKQLCRSVPIQCVPGTIAETPVPVRYVMRIEPKNRE